MIYPKLSFNKLTDLVIVYYSVDKHDMSYFTTCTCTLKTAIAKFKKNDYINVLKPVVKLPMFSVVLKIQFFATINYQNIFRRMTQHINLSSA